MKSFEKKITFGDEEFKIPFDRFVDVGDINCGVKIGRAGTAGAIVSFGFDCLLTPSVGLLTEVT